MELDDELAKTYNKDQTRDQDLSIEVFNLFVKTIGEERKARYDKKVLKYNAETSAEKKMPESPVMGVSIVDPVLSNGVRALRYMKEMQGLRHITVNDWGPSYREAFEHNMKLNGISPELVTITSYFKERVLSEFSEHEHNVDIVDLQDVGDASSLDAAIQALVSDGGLLCVRSTNIQALSTNASDACFARFGSLPVRTQFGKESAVRVLLHAIDAAANRHKRGIQPWLAVCHDQHVRMFVRVWKTPSGAQAAMQNSVMLHYSSLCHSFFHHRLSDKNALTNVHWPQDSLAVHHETREKDVMDPVEALFGTDSSANDAAIDALFEDSHSPSTDAVIAYKTRSRSKPTFYDLPELTGVPARHWQTGGPYWGGELHDQEVVDALLAKFKSYEFRNPRLKTVKRKPETTTKQIALLSAVSDELKDVPFSYCLHSMCGVLQCSLPSLLELMSAVQNAGYRVSNFHADSQAIKTDAPSDVVSAFIPSTNCVRSSR